MAAKAPPLVLWYSRDKAVEQPRPTPSFVGPMPAAPPAAPKPVLPVPRVAPFFPAPLPTPTVTLPPPIPVQVPTLAPTCVQQCRAPFWKAQESARATPAQLEALHAEYAAMKKCTAACPPE